MGLLDIKFKLFIIVRAVLLISKIENQYIKIIID